MDFIGGSTFGGHFTLQNGCVPYSPQLEPPLKYNDLCMDKSGCHGTGVSRVFLLYKKCLAQ